MQYICKNNVGGKIPYEGPEIVVYGKETAVEWAVPKTGCAPFGSSEEKCNCTMGQARVSYSTAKKN